MSRYVVSLPVVVAGLAAAFLALGLFSQTVYNTAHNEQMYVAAGYLLAQGKRLYRDFAFVQMPYTPLVYAAVYSFSPGGYLLKAKLVNLLWLAVASGLLVGRAARVTQDRLLALLLLVLFLADYYLLRAAIEASNYTLPIAASLLAYGWLLRGVAEEAQPWTSALAAFGAGAALGVATGAKLYYLPLVAAFGLVSLLYPRGRPVAGRWVWGALPLVAGLLVGLAPALVYAARDLDRFLFNNLGYHTLNTLWREQNGFTDMGWRAKLEAARDLATNPNYLILLLWLALAGLLRWNRRTEAGRAPLIPARPGVILAGGAAVISLLAAFTPRPLFPQYFAMPVPFLLLWVAELAPGLPAPSRRLLRAFGVVIAVAGILAVLPRHTGSLRRLAAGEPWAGTVAIRESQTLRRWLDERGPVRNGTAWIATLSPVVALESGLPFYPELATGSFVYRIGDLLTPEERARYVATSPTALPALLDAHPPAAIFIGEEGELEQPLLDYAERHGYQPAPHPFSEGQVFLR
ncbi:MAG TPA: hypothetical protein VNK95_10195 [Caldilineaceae bacterium]|nr:hypothetical protein [Caldilineaceae bacterium]